MHKAYAQTPEQVSGLTIEPDTSVPIKDGPPCLQILAREKISEGGRNNGLFNLGVYLRKAYPDSWESEFLNYNAQYLDPPLGLDEVNIVAKQLQKKTMLTNARTHRSATTATRSYVRHGSLV